MASYRSERIRYEADSLLGRGGFSSVFKGFFDEKPVAVKRILKEDADGREEKILAEVSHRNILKLLHTEEDGIFR